MAAKRNPAAPESISGQDVPDDLPMHVGQPVVAALEAIGQLLVVQAQQVEDGGLEVVDVDPSLATEKPSSSDSPWV